LLQFPGPNNGAADASCVKLIDVSILTAPTAATMGIIATIVAIAIIVVTIIAAEIRYKYLA
jgi:hypothetical protein